MANAPDNIQSTVKTVLLEILPHLSEGELTDDGNLLEQLDSISVMTLITTLEERCSIKFEPDELSMEIFESINAISQTIKYKQGD